MSTHQHVLEILRLKDKAPITLDPKKTALLVIDMQRYFVHAEHAFSQVFEKLVPGTTAEYFERVQKMVIPNIRRLQQCFRSLKLPIFFTATGTSLGDGRDLPKWLRDFDEMGLNLLGKRIWPSPDDPSYQIDESVAPLAGEVVLHKCTSGPLNSTGLDHTLHNLGITGLVVGGLTTDVCVTQTARETADRGFDVVIAEDACATFSEEMHRAALQVFSLAFGRVRITEEVVRFMSPGGSAAKTA